MKCVSLVDKRKFEITEMDEPKVDGTNVVIEVKKIWYMWF